MNEHRILRYDRSECLSIKLPANGGQSLVIEQLAKSNPFFESYLMKRNRCCLEGEVIVFD